MVSEFKMTQVRILSKCVLILIVLEDGLWECLITMLLNIFRVLILIVLEDGLWEIPGRSKAYCKDVLILIVLEDGLWGSNA